MKKLYRVEVEGCDDTTSFDLEMTEEEFTFLSMVAKRCCDESAYVCMPRMYVKEKEHAE